MLSPRQESHAIGKARSSSTSSDRPSGRREWAQVSPSPSSGPSAPHGTIRVIHIFAPKIIKTDVANFRELVQRLTGNSSTSRKAKKRSGSKSSRRGRGGLKSGSSGPGTSRFDSMNLDDNSMPSHPAPQHILSQYGTATQIFASSNRVEYTISRATSTTDHHRYTAPPQAEVRASDHHHQRYTSTPQAFSPPSVLDFSTQRDGGLDVKPALRNGEGPAAYIQCSGGSSSSQSSTRSGLPPVEVSSPYFQAHHNHHASDFSREFDSSPGGSCIGGSVHEEEDQPAMVDPFQSLSGYREKLSSLPQKFSSAFPAFDDSRQYMFNSKFSDMDILTGLVSPGPLPEFLLPHPIGTSNTTVNNNLASDFSFQSSLLNPPNSLCRFAVQSPLHGGVSQLFEYF